LAFFFEASEFSAIVNNRKQFPEQQQRKADSHHSTDDAQNDAQNVQHWGTLFRFLDANDKFALVSAVNECHTTVVVIVEPALSVASALLCCSNIDFNGYERAVLAFILTFWCAQFTCFEHLALDARNVLVAFARASWAFLTKLTRVAASVLFDALAFATDTFSFTRARLTSTWGYASFGSISARTIRALPSGFAHALTAFASAVIRSGARQPIVVIAREIVTLTELTAHLFVGILADVAVAEAADARSTIVAENVGGVVRSAPGFVVSETGRIGIALAVPASIGIEEAG